MYRLHDDVSLVSAKILFFHRSLDMSAIFARSHADLLAEETVEVRDIVKAA